MCTKFISTSIISISTHLHLHGSHLHLHVGFPSTGLLTHSPPTARRSLRHLYPSLIFISIRLHVTSPSARYVSIYTSLIRTKFICTAFYPPTDQLVGGSIPAPPSPLPHTHKAHMYPPVHVMPLVMFSVARLCMAIVLQS